MIVIASDPPCRESEAICQAIRFYCHDLQVVDENREVEIGFSQIFRLKPFMVCHIYHELKLVAINKII